MKSEEVKKVFEILKTLCEMIEPIKNYWRERDNERFMKLANDFADGLVAVKDYVQQNLPEDNKAVFSASCDSVLESLVDICELAIKKSPEVEWKLEHELAVLMSSLIIMFYYRNIDPENTDDINAFYDFLLNTKSFSCYKNGEDAEYDMDLSIIVTGYNKLDYTQRCVNSILRVLPSDINYELILINHGSSDGTKEFFESVANAHVLNVKINGSAPLYCLGLASGRYSLYISNDTIIGVNAINNLYRCISEHSQYGFLVPTTPAVSNLQTIEAEYQSENEFYDFTDKNNIYDEKRHEQRVRLCNPISMLSTYVLNKMYYEEFDAFFGNGSMHSFPDDKVSLWMRRNGYKNVLCKDAYCHHFGSVTLREQPEIVKKQQEFYNEGRLQFEKKYGIDPWGPGFCYDKSLMEHILVTEATDITVLGLNCGLGSNPLKVASLYREETDAVVNLYCAEQDERYQKDLKGIVDEPLIFSSIEEIIPKIKQNRIDYLLVERNVLGYSDLAQLVLPFLKKGYTICNMLLKTDEGKWVKVNLQIS